MTWSTWSLFSSEKIAAHFLVTTDFTDGNLFGFVCRTGPMKWRNGLEFVSHRWWSIRGKRKTSTAIWVCIFSPAALSLFFNVQSKVPMTGRGGGQILLTVFLLIRVLPMRLATVSTCAFCFVLCFCCFWLIVFSWPVSSENLSLKSSVFEKLRIWKITKNTKLTKWNYGKTLW